MYTKRGTTVRLRAEHKRAEKATSASAAAAQLVITPSRQRSRRADPDIGTPHAWAWRRHVSSKRISTRARAARWDGRVPAVHAGGEPAFMNTSLMSTAP